METIIQAVTTYFSGTLGQVELAGTIFSLICVYLATKHNIWTWFWGALGVICFGYLFFQVQLYSDAGLQLLFFLPMQVAGYIWWKRDVGRFVVRRLSAMKSVLITVGIICATVINGYLMFTYTDASFPYADALTTWMSVAAQILMLKKFLENWTLWVAMDAIAISIYFFKGLFVVSGLYVMFFCLASYGLYKWYTIVREQRMERLKDAFDQCTRYRSLDRSEQ